ncbi:MAG: flagellin [Lachnospiraceae bacterium]|nr:flagellin [Lachnospiraceae bacterium]
MIIQHNLQAMNANRMLGSVTTKQSGSVKKLSSGYKINSAADDAAGLSISEKMRSQIRGLDKASNNAQDGVSLIQVAEGALNEVHSILHRMNELATQAANDTNTSVDREQIKDEIDQLATEIDRVARLTQFNTMNLLDGSFKDKNLQVGALSGQNIELDVKAMDTHGLGLAFVFNNPAEIDAILEKTPSIEYIEKNDEKDTAYPGWQSFDVGTGKKNLYKPKQCLFVDSHENAGRTMRLVQNAVGLVSQMRSSLGAVQNRLEHTIANLDNTSENTSAAESRIRDVDMAEEMVTYSTNNILAQAGQSMLAQANQNSQGVLSLLQ